MNFDNIPDPVLAVILLVALGMLIWSILDVVGESRERQAWADLGDIDLDNPPMKEKHRYPVAPEDVQLALRLVADPRMDEHTDAFVGAWNHVEQGAYWFTEIVGSPRYRVVGRGFISEPIGVTLEQPYCAKHRCTAIDLEHCAYPFYKSYTLSLSLRRKEIKELSKDCDIRLLVMAYPWGMPEGIEHEVGSVEP